eukprot:TRINITY_DN47960_c0_g1_i1.p1 TRINITY_DN47960_c0_g1~~TRINITY_DN47960_c0_g1_i1.p1  ORF type:complete len:362 (-),score=81.04 TRINITY_DN47960_c0_g1_i1:44-1129(-)
MGSGRSALVSEAPGSDACPSSVEEQEVQRSEDCQSELGEASTVYEDEWCFIEHSLDESEQDFLEGSVPRGPLDERAFVNFAPLLAASQEYAGLSGCRFRSDSFSCLSGSPKEVKCSASQWTESTVREFADRLTARDPALLEEMEEALRIVMEESVRNAMIAAFREADLWPPEPRPEGIDDDDCRYEDLSSPVPVIAQRIWNDEVKRRQDTDSGDGRGSQFRRAVTASYLVDFAYEVGAQLPAADERHMAMLSEFGAQMAEWNQAKRSAEAGCDASSPSRHGAALVLASATEKGACCDAQLEEAPQWADSLRDVAWTLASAVVIGAAATAGINFTRRSAADEVTEEAEKRKEDTSPSTSCNE